MKSIAPRSKRPVVEELEPRVLFSADLSPVTLTMDMAGPAVEHRTLNEDGEFSSGEGQTGASDQQTRKREVVFIDAATPDIGGLVGEIRAQADNQSSIEVFLIEGGADGIETISATLRERSDVSTVHIVSHGTDGELQLGNTRLNFDTLLKNASQIKHWGDALSTDADILIYGCDVAEGEAGRALVDALARLTGADVAASDDLTGSVTLGGDWDLEYLVGEMDDAVVLELNGEEAWEHLLELDSTGTGSGLAGESSTPLAFEQNVGQVGSEVDFIARGGGYAVALRDGDAVIEIRDGEFCAIFTLDASGANPTPTAVAEGLLQGRTNYLVGSQDNWLTDIENYGAVSYQDVYDGIDLRYYGNQRQLEYDFIVDAGADVSSIKLRFDGVESISIAANGDLLLNIEGLSKAVAFNAPIAYQDGEQGREIVFSEYQLLDDGTVGFRLGDYDHSRELVIDPILSYGTYVGTGNSEAVQDMAVDGQGNVYLAGYASTSGG